MLNVNEIFTSIDGEVCGVGGQGGLTTFIRLQGCNLFPPCSYCDTKRAQNSGRTRHKMSVGDIIKILNDADTQKVTITGGEPLLQNETETLIIDLIHNDIKVSVETNGSMPIPKMIKYDYLLSWVIDYKLQYQDKMCIDNFWDATRQDWIKFVIETPSDFQKAVDIYIALKEGGCKARIAFSPVISNNDSASGQQWLAERIIEKKLWDVTLNLQIHKLIWPNKSEGISLL